jgi:hypothetical protein
MALIYRGHEVQTHDVVVDTVDAGKGTYRGAPVSFHRASDFRHRVTPTKHYRGVTY